MERHPLEQSVLDDNEKKLELCVNISFLIHQSGFGEEFKAINEQVIKKAAGYHTIIQYMNNNKIINTNKTTT